VGDHPDRPYVLLSCAMSLDGHLDDATGTRLMLSDAADTDRVDGVRAGCDAILVGAGTVRRDDPRLLVRSADRRNARVASGRSASPAKVTLTGTGDLDPTALFFTAGIAEKLVYAATPAVDGARRRLGGVAAVLDGGDPLDLDRVLADLAARGVGRLMVEGGTTVLTGFLAAGLADELQLVVAPFLVGDAAAPRLVGDGPFRWDARRPARLVEVRRIGELVLLRYGLSDRCGPP
jgi:5-amino-6-(5-phosphoribosylamino)uracil reductase